MKRRHGKIDDFFRPIWGICDCFMRSLCIIRVTDQNVGLHHVNKLMFIVKCVETI